MGESDTWGLFWVVVAAAGCRRVAGFEGFDRIGNSTLFVGQRRPSNRGRNVTESTEFGQTNALVGVIMGSRNDWETMKAAAEILAELEIAHEKLVVSAHRTPARMVSYAQSAADRGIRVIIAGAGGAAHLPGMVASETNLPVIGVPVQSRALQGLDSLLSIVQMPGGIPVATMSIGVSGAKNAGIYAARILALTDPDLRDRLATFVNNQTQAVLDSAEL
jgi:5-(carboxyamino)imidazole ribonucleotide mutase